MLGLRKNYWQKLQTMGPALAECLGKKKSTVIPIVIGTLGAIPKEILYLEIL